jgi:hypothetical protein
MLHFVKKHPFVLIFGVINAVVFDMFRWVNVGRVPGYYDIT